MSDFEMIVLKMRTAQRNFFRTRDQRYLRESKQLEHSVDSRLADMVDEQGELFSRTQTQDELFRRVADLESAIQRCCRNCWANDATDAAQCRLCGLKEALKGAEN